MQRQQLIATGLLLLCAAQATGIRVFAQEATPDDIQRYRTSVVEKLRPAWRGNNASRGGTLNLSIDKSGKVVSAEVAQTSGDPKVDAGLVSVVKALQFPPLPWCKTGTCEITIGVALSDLIFNANPFAGAMPFAPAQQPVKPASLKEISAQDKAYDQQLRLFYQTVTDRIQLDEKNLDRQKLIQQAAEVLASGLKFQAAMLYLAAASQPLSTGDLPSAKQLIDKATAIIPDLSEAEQDQVANGISTIYQSAFRFGPPNNQGREYFLEHTLKSLTKLAASNSIKIKPLNQNLADLYKQEGHWPEAERLYNQIVSELLANDPADYRSLEQAYMQLSTIYSQEKQPQKAEQALSSAIAMHEKTNGPNDSALLGLYGMRLGTLTGSDDPNWEPAVSRLEKFADTCDQPVPIVLVDRFGAPDQKCIAPDNTIEMLSSYSSRHPEQKLDSSTLERLARLAYKLQLKRCPYGSWTPRILNSLCDVLIFNGKGAEALQLYKDALAGWQEHEPKNTQVEQIKQAYTRALTRLGQTSQLPQ